MTLEYPGQSLSMAKRELAQVSPSNPAAPAQLAFITKRLGDTVAAYSRVADVVGDAESAAMARLVSARMSAVAGTLSAGVGSVPPGSRGEYITGLCDSALTVMEARESEMDLAEAALVAVTAAEALGGVRRQVRAGLASGQWEHVSPSTSRELGEVIGMANILAANATHTVVTGGGLGRRRRPEGTERHEGRSMPSPGAQDTPRPDEGRGMSR